MKKTKKILFLFLSIILCFSIFFINLKVNARIDIDYNNSIAQKFIVLAPPPLTRGLQEDRSYGILENVFDDPDGHYNNTLLQIWKTSTYNDRYILGANGSYFSPNIYLFMDKFYGFHFYTYQNTTRIDIYNINTNYDSSAGEISFSVGSILKTIYASYNISGGDSASNIKYYFNFVSLLSNHEESSSTIWQTSTLNYILNNYFNMELFNYQIIDAYDNGYDDGYDIGYDAGYVAGENTITPLNRVWNIIGGIFQAVSNVMAIELFPHIPLGTFFLIPLIFGAIGFIFWIWKRGS